MRTLTRMMAGVSVVALIGVAPASAQDIVKLSEFDQSQLENAWSAKQIQDATVYGADGNEVGNVQGIVVGPDDKAQQVVVETGGVLAPGKAIAVPFDQVDLTPGEEGIQTPVSKGNVQDFSLFTDRGQAMMDERSFRASEVIGDYVRLTQARDYGYVSDLIFEPDGTLKSVVVAPDVGWEEGYYSAFPWHGYEYGFDPGAEVYELPYAEEEVLEYAGAYENWDYDGLFEGHL